jgi:glutaredoxin
MSPATDNGWEPERGLNTRYECPECAYARTGVTTSRHTFETHLIEEHGYALDEIAQVIAESR